MVQSRLPGGGPGMVSGAKGPPTLRSWLPVTLPFSSNVTKPTAATGAGPLGRINVPVVVNPKLAAAVALVQAACRPGTTPKIDHIINASIFVLFMEFLLLNANLLFRCWQVRIFRIPIQEGIQQMVLCHQCRWGSIPCVSPLSL